MNNKIDNIYDIIQTIRDYEQKHGEKFRLYENTWQKIPFLIAIFAFIGSLILALAHRWVLPSSIDVRGWGYLMLFASLIFIVIYEVFLFIPVLKALFKPTDTYLSRVQKAAKTETELIEILADAKLPALEQAVERLDYEVSSLESRITAVTGVFQKMGIVPAAVALYIAYAKKDIGESQLVFKHIDYVLYFIFGVYIGALIMRNVIDRFRLFSILIKAAKDKAEFRSAFQKP
jgi:hypothetical protein